MPVVNMGLTAAGDEGSVEGLPDFAIAIACGYEVAVVVGNEVCNVSITWVSCC
jgi:2-methylcitrate dehydratase PrpD